jgi:hypothetical protein
MLLRLVLGLANPVVSVIHLRMLMGIHPGRSRSMLMGCQGCILYSRDAAKGKRPGRKVGSGVILLVLRMCSTPIACVLARSTHYAVNESSPRTSPILVHAWSDRANPSGSFSFHRCVEVLSYQRSFPHVSSLLRHPP